MTNSTTVQGNALVIVSRNMLVIRKVGLVEKLSTTQTIGLALDSVVYDLEKGEKLSMSQFHQKISSEHKCSISQAENTHAKVSEIINNIKGLFNNK